MAPINTQLANAIFHIHVVEDPVHVVAVATTVLYRPCLQVVRENTSTPDISGSAPSSPREDGPDRQPPAIQVTVAQAEHPPPSWPALGRVEFIDLTASYTWDAPKPALRGLSVTITGGSSCGFVGRSGSGKSTTVLALAGMIPIVKGRLELDGLDIRSVPMLALRGTMAVVLQVRALPTLLGVTCFSVASLPGGFRAWRLLCLVVLQLIYASSSCSCECYFIYFVCRRQCFFTAACATTWTSRGCARTSRLWRLWRQWGWWRWRPPSGVWMGICRPR